MMERIAVMGLGYVGLPVALAFARKFPETIGFDVNVARVEELKQGRDRNGETKDEELSGTSLVITSDASKLGDVTKFVVAVPTPVAENNVPASTPLIKASEFVGKVLKAGAVVCYESTVYPGATEEVCGPILERVSG